MMMTLDYIGGDIMLLIILVDLSLVLRIDEVRVNVYFIRKLLLLCVRSTETEYVIQSNFLNGQLF